MDSKAFSQRKNDIAINRYRNMLRWYEPAKHFYHFSPKMRSAFLHLYCQTNKLKLLDFGKGTTDYSVSPPKFTPHEPKITENDCGKFASAIIFDDVHNIDLQEKE